MTSNHSNCTPSDSSARTVADSWTNIGIVYGKKGDRAAATEMYTKAYHIFLKVLGPHHPETQGLKPFVPSVHEETLDAAMRALTVGEEEEDEEGEEGDSDQGEEEDQAGDSGER